MAGGGLFESYWRGFLLSQPMLLAVLFATMVEPLFGRPGAAMSLIPTVLAIVGIAAGGWVIGRTREPLATLVFAVAIPVLVGGLLGLWLFVEVSAAAVAGFLTGRFALRRSAERDLSSE